LITVFSKYADLVLIPAGTNSAVCERRCLASADLLKSSVTAAAINNKENLTKIITRISPTDYSPTITILCREIFGHAD
jgi:hypothetical protein